MKDNSSKMLLNTGDIYRQNGGPGEQPDTSGKLIVGVMIALVVIMFLPKIKLFQDLTAINGWIPFFRNLFGL